MISYTPTGIIISDDLNSDRAPLILPPDAHSEVEAAVASYLGPEALMRAPDYVGFYNTLLASSLYAGVLAVPATADLARAMVVFVSAIQDCMAGRENRNAMQGAIWLLLSQLPLDAEHALELQNLMTQHHLAGIYTLQPPLERARDEEGRFLPDDPSTPDVNEAWVQP